MKVLLDECVPRTLKRVIVSHGHDCTTAQEAGWAGKKNGELLDLAEQEFDVLVTVDSNIPYQQALAGRKLSLFVLEAKSNRLEDLVPLFSSCIAELDRVELGKVTVITSK